MGVRPYYQGMSGLPAGSPAAGLSPGEATRAGSTPVVEPGPFRQTLARVVLPAIDAFRRLVVALLRADHTAGRERISNVEFRELVAANTVLPREERRLIDEVLSAGARHVNELMVPRTEVVFLDAALTVDAALGLVREARHS